MTDGRKLLRSAALAATALAAAGCIGVGFVPVVAPALDTKGEVGFEARLELVLATGGPDSRFFMAEGTGYGYSDDYAHHLQQTVALGAEVGDYGPDQRLVGHVAGAFAIRAGQAGPAYGGHVLLDLFAMLAESQRFSYEFLLGPRLEAGVAYLDTSPEHPDAEGVRGIFSLGLAFRLTLFGGHRSYHGRPRPSDAPPPPPPTTTDPLRPVSAP